MSILLAFDNVKNARDLGGIPAAGGRLIREGRLVRSGNLSGAGAEDRDKLAALCDTVVDFRTDKERREAPDPALPGVRLLSLPVIESLTAGVTREKDADELAMRILMESAERTRAYMENGYRGFVESPAAVRGYAAFVRLLAEDHPRAVLWHCTAGKDRAGFAAVIAEEILGVDRDVIRADYIRTNEILREDIEQLTESAMRAFGASGAEAEKSLRAMFGADLSYLDTLYEAAEERYGSFGGYLSLALGVTEEIREKIRCLYLGA